MSKICFLNASSISYLSNCPNLFSLSKTIEKQLKNNYYKSFAIFYDLPQFSRPNLKASNLEMLFFKLNALFFSIHLRQKVCSFESKIKDIKQSEKFCSLINSFQKEQA